MFKSPVLAIFCYNVVMDNNAQQPAAIEEQNDGLEQRYKRWKKIHRALGWGITVGYPIVMVVFTLAMYSLEASHTPNIQPFFALISVLICLPIFIFESMLAAYIREGGVPYLMAAIVAIVPPLIAFVLTIPNMLEGNFGVYRAVFGEFPLTIDVPLIAILILAIVNIKKAKK